MEVRIFFILIPVAVLAFIASLGKLGRLSAKRAEPRGFEVLPPLETQTRNIGEGHHG